MSFRLENFSSVILLKIIFWALELRFFYSCGSYFSLFKMSQISWLFSIRHSSYLTYSFTDASISSIISSTPEILCSVSPILLVILVSIAPVHLSDFSVYKISSVWVLIFVSISIFQVLALNIFLQLLVCSWLSLSDLFISSKCLLGFSQISLRSLFISSLRTYIMCRNLGFKVVFL